MADTTQEKSSQLTLGDESHKITVSWSSKAPRRVLLATSDPRFTDENGEKPGLRTVFSANPKSADYDPAQFNRIARALRQAGLDAPDEVPVRPRQIKQRRSVIAGGGGGKAGKARGNRAGKQGKGPRGKKTAASPRAAKRAAPAKRASAKPAE